MPTSARRACLHPGCGRSARGAYCEQHRRAREQHRRQTDPSIGFYKTHRWRKFRAWFLRRNPLCMECLQRNRTVVATQVDHKIPRRVRPDLEYDEGNCQPLCAGCHSRKTLRERQGGRGGGK